MNLELKYNIGDTIYIVNEFTYEIHKKTIDKIHIIIDSDGYHREYIVQRNSFKESALFKTKEEAKKYILREEIERHNRHMDFINKM